MSDDFSSLIVSAMDSLNRRRFEALAALLDEDCVLDMPGGSRVIGSESLRNTLAEFLLRHDVSFADILAMTDASGIRGAAEMTARGNWQAGDGEQIAGSLPVVWIFERSEPGGKFVRISFYGAVAA